VKEPKAQRTLVMTGGSSGFGRNAAAHLLRDHPDQHLVLTVRGGYGERLAAELTAETGNPNVSTVPCDLSSLSDIRTAAAEITGRLGTGDLPPLRGFLGNAGVQMPSITRTTEDGFEMTFGVNVLAHYLMLRLLLDWFVAPSRLIITSSGSHFADFRHTLGVVPPPKWSDTQTIAKPGSGPAADSAREGQRAYATSKLAVIYLVHALARRLPPGIDVYSYNPGAVPNTGLSRNASPAIQFIAGLLVNALRVTPFASDVDTAGRLLATVAAGPRPGESGSYIDQGKIIPSSPASYDKDREEELWTTAARLAGLDRNNAPIVARLRSPSSGGGLVGHRPIR
jgi:NAD(P)-dependent dehydrogenase (short-subunit alcohol dehydrogenase family)